jgi:hypothetical protein
MSWMTKGGSSSASEQSPLHFPHNARAQREAASNKYEAPAARCEFVPNKQSDPSSRDTTKGSGPCWTVKAVGKPLDQGGIYRSEGFA